jgi:hypothetical protein
MPQQKLPIKIFTPASGIHSKPMQRLKEYITEK